MKNISEFIDAFKQIILCSLKFYLCYKKKVSSLLGHNPTIEMLNVFGYNHTLASSWFSIVSFRFSIKL